MPICPNCVSGVGFKDGLVCQSCGFDFKVYTWVPVSWGFLRFKFQKKTPWNLVRTVFWMSAPPVGCVWMYSAMGDRRFTLVGLAVLTVIVIPMTIFFTVAPVIAFFKKDEIREVSRLVPSQGPAWPTKSRPHSTQI